MKRDSFIVHLTEIGRIFKTLSNNDEHFDTTGVNAGLTEKFYAGFRFAGIKNPWFTESNLKSSFSAWSDQLTQESLEKFFAHYPETHPGKTVAVIMAGNIPLVGFHDLVCVLASGNRALLKLSTDDEVLMRLVVEVLYGLDPEFRELVKISEGPLKNFDAVLATGSDNTSRYFEHYFAKYPHVIRKNRTSLGVLTGNESAGELEKLGSDIFAYFGMGCRNISHLLVPRGYDFSGFFEAMLPYGHLINHNKYVNNYEYHRAIFLLEQLPFLDNNFLMIRENRELFSPLSVIHYSFYDSKDEITDYILDNSAKIQCVVGEGYIPFGKAQQPELADYADGVDTMEFLGKL